MADPKKTLANGQETYEGPGQTPKLPDRTERENALRKIREAVEKTRDLNGAFANELMDLDARRNANEQREGLTFQKFELLSVLIKIKKEQPNLNLTKINPSQLSTLAHGSNIELTPLEVVALGNLDSILNQPNTPLYREMITNWPVLASEAEKASEGVTGKVKKLGKSYVERLKKDPAGTILLTMAGAFGIYVGTKALKWIAKKGWSRVKEKGTADLNKLMSPTGILSMLGVTAVGGYLGRDWLKNKLYEKFGLKLGDEKVQRFLESLQKGEEPAELVEILNKIQAGKGMSKEAFEKLLEKKNIPKTPAIEVALADGFVTEHEAKTLLAYAAKQTVREKTGVGFESKETKEKYIQFAELIKSSNEDLEVNPLLLSYLEATPYETFMKESGSWTGLMRSFASWLDKKNIPDKETLKKLATYGAVSLGRFFKEMIKDEGDLDEFKGKTIGQVIELINAKPENYIDPEAVKAAKEQQNKYAKLWKMLKQGGKNPTLFASEEWRAELMNVATLAGVSFMWDRTVNGSMFMIRNGWDIVKISSQTISDGLQKTANDLINQGGIAAAGGVYLTIAKYSVAFGAPLYGLTTMGEKLITRGPIGGLLGLPHGMIRGAWKGAILPGKLMVASGKALFTGQFSPIEDVKEWTRQKKHLLDDLAQGNLGHRRLGMETLSQKILAGSKELNDGTIKQLETSRRLFARQIDLLRAKAKSATFKKWAITEHISRLEDELKNIDHLLQFQSKVSKGFSGMKWNEALKKLNVPELESILQKNKNIGLLLMDEKFPLNGLLKTHPEQSATLIRLFETDKKLFLTLVKNPEIFGEPQFMEAFAKLKPGQTGNLLEATKKSLEKANKRTKWMREIAFEDIEKARKLDALSVTTYEQIAERQKAIKALQGEIAEAMKKHPGMGLEAFFDGPGKTLGEKMNKLNDEIVVQTKGFTARIADILSDGEYKTLEKLPKNLRKYAYEFILATADKEVALPNRIAGKLFNKIGGRLIIFAPILGLRAYLNEDKEKLSDELLTTGIMMIPVVGTYYDFKAAITGTDISGDKVSRLESLGWAIVGTGMDIAIVFGGTGLAARVAAKGLRAGGRFAKAARKAEKAGKAIEAIKSGQRVEQAGKLAFGGTLAMTTFMVGKIACEWITKPKEVAVLDTSGLEIEL